MSDDPVINSTPYLDNANNALLQQLGKLLNGQDITAIPLPQLRAAFRKANSPPPPHPNVEITHFEVKTAHGNVKTFMWRPKHCEYDVPFVYHIHGGGWILADAFDYTGFLSDIVERTGVAVVFPQYTLALEKTFPVQQEQCVEVLQYLVKHGHEKSLLVDRIVISGDSAGGQLAPAVSIINHQKNLNLPIVHQILISPIVDLTSLWSTFSQWEFQNGPFLTSGFIEESLRDYIPDVKDRKTITASPMLMTAEEAKEYMPPTTILTSQADWLRDQGQNFAKLLQQAGVSCGVMQLVASVHDPLIFDKSRAGATSELALIVMAGKIKEALGNGNGGEAEAGMNGGVDGKTSKRKRRS